MQIAIAIAMLIILVCLIVACSLLHHRKTKPDTMLIAVRSGGLRWTPFSGCLRDAREEGWVWAVTKNKEIIRVDTGEYTGRKFVDLPKQEHKYGG